MRDTESTLLLRVNTALISLNSQQQRNYFHMTAQSLLIMNYILQYLILYIGIFSLQQQCHAATSAVGQEDRKISVYEYVKSLAKSSEGSHVAYDWVQRNIVERSDHKQEDLSTLHDLYVQSVHGLRDASRGSDAIKVLDTAIGEFPKSPLLRFLLGQTAQYWCKDLIGSEFQRLCEGSNEFSMRQYEQSWELYQSSRDEDMGPLVPGMLNDLALIYSQIGELQLAELGFRIAIDLDKTFLGAIVNLAGVLIAAGRASDPEVDSLYQQALAISSDRSIQRSILLHNFGVHRYSLGDVQMARILWEEAVSIDPRRYDTLSNIASLLCSSGDMQGAEKNFLDAIDLLVQDSSQVEFLAKTFIQGLTGIVPIIYNSSSQGLQIREKFVRNLMILDSEYRNTYYDSLSEAVDVKLLNIAAQIQSLKLDDPFNVVGCGSLGYYLIYDGGDNLLPRTLLARVFRQVFPMLSFVSPYLIGASSTLYNYTKNDKFLREFVETTVIEHRRRSHNSCLPNPSNTDLQISIISYPFPKVKVAFLSAFWYTHSVGLLMKAVILGISRELYTVVIISTHSSIFIENDVDWGLEIDHTIPVTQNGRPLPATTNRRVVKGDSVTVDLFNSAEELHIFTFENIKVMQSSISELKLNILVYGEIGMDIKTYFLSFSRLAERTIGFWGHATTSGISASDGYLANVKRSEAGGMDYFVSSMLLDDEGSSAQRKYSERLILMRGMTSSFPRPEKPFSAVELGILSSDSRELPFKRDYLIHLQPELDAILPLEFTFYAVPQTLYKVHPDFDLLLAKILSSDKKGFIFVPTGNLSPSWISHLNERLIKSLGPEAFARIVYIPAMNHRQYITFNAIADVILDTFPVGGGRSSFEIFSVGTPIVVLFPRTSILQLTTGMYVAMGLLTKFNGVTYTDEDFVKKATQIANNKTLSSSIRDSILENNHVLYTPAAQMVTRWEPKDLADIFTYFNDSTLRPHGYERTIKEWNKMIFFVANSPRPKYRGNKFQTAIRLNTIRISSIDSPVHSLLLSSSDQSILEPYCLTSRPRKEDRNGRENRNFVSFEESGSISGPAKGSTIFEMSCVPCEDIYTDTV